MTVRRLPRALGVGVLLAAVVFGMPGRAHSETWKYVPGLDAQASPAMAGYNGALYVGGVNLGGGFTYATTRKPGEWDAPATIPGTPPGGLHRTTEPVLLADGGLLYAFARGEDDNLYRAVKSASGSFTPWLAWTFDAAVRGRLSVAVTRPPVDPLDPVVRPPEIHVLHRSGSTYVTYRRFRLDGTQVAARTWTGFVDGTLGGNGSNGVAVALMASAGIRCLAVRLNSRGGWTWRILGFRYPTGAEGEIQDVSDVVFFAGSYHVLYSLRTLMFGTVGGYAMELRHARFILGGFDDGFTQEVAASLAGDASPILSYLVVYRSKLVSAYRDWAGNVRSARWDSADPAAPWIGGEVGGADERSSGRPMLATLNLRPAVADFTRPGFGDDVFAAIRGFEGFAEGFFYFADFSQEMARRELAKQVGVFDAHLPAGCPATTPPYFVPLATEGRPVLSELAHELWMLPTWLSGHIFGDVGREGCAITSPYYGPTCTAARLAVVLQCPNSGIFVNTFASTWVNVDNDYARIFEEFGHQLASGLGFDDTGSGSPPNAADKERSGIPLDVLLDGYALFGTNSSRCGSLPVPGRCVGFTKNPYEWNNGKGNAPSRQHHFLYLLLYYFSAGDEVRQWISDDLSGANTYGTTGAPGERSLLRRKYNWIRWNIYRGIEFRRDGEPLTPF